MDDDQPEQTPEQITDALIGTDEKICSCSQRVAELLLESTEMEKGGRKGGTFLAVFEALAGKGGRSE